MHVSKISFISLRVSFIFFDSANSNNAQGLETDDENYNGIFLRSKECKQSFKRREFLSARGFKKQK